VLFVQSVADLATRPQNVEALMNAGVMALLRPLLLDNVPSIQQSAALALGRLANYNDDLAEAVVSNDILPQLVYQLSEQNVRACPAPPPLPAIFAADTTLRPPSALLQKGRRLCAARRR